MSLEDRHTGSRETTVGAHETGDEATSGSPQEETQGLLNAVFDSIEDGILILQPKKMIILRANAAAGRLFGVEADQLIGKPILQMLSEKKRNVELSKTISEKLPYLKRIHLDLEMRRIGGGVFPAFHGISEIENPGGEAEAWLWIITDMSQRVFLNRALISLETRYRLLFDRSADPTLIIDAETGKIIDSNRASETQLGYSRSELIGLGMEDLTPVHRRGAMGTDFYSIPLSESVTFEGCNLTKSGESVPVQISVVATEFEGKKVFIANCRDITQQRALEQERLRVEKLDAARKIAGGLAHEFSQPLQGLTTIVDLLREPDIPEKQRDDLIAKIAPSVERMVALLDQMKRIVRLETKPYAGEEAIVDIGHSTQDEGEGR